MEDAAENFKDNNVAVIPYERLGISNYFKRWMYEESGKAGQKLAGFLNQYLAEIDEGLDKNQSNGNPAGGGTTTGARQGNTQLDADFKALENAYGVYGTWSYPNNDPNVPNKYPNPFENWKDEPRLVPDVDDPMDIDS